MSDGAPDYPSPIGPHVSTPRELQERLKAERSGQPHLIYRESGHQVIRMLAAADSRLRIGRDPEREITLEDAEVSRRHAKLEAAGGDWTVLDEGSKNGSFLNGERLGGPRLLRDGDTLIFGTTVLVFRSPGVSRGYTTRPGANTLIRHTVTNETDRRVLVALCRPKKDSPHAHPASNETIAHELSMSVPAVKKRLTALYRSFHLEHLPQSVKRTQLAIAALQSGIVSQRDL
jgi:hypothetical protein